MNAIPSTSNTKSHRSTASCRFSIPNFGGQFLGWRPWDYEKDRATRKATSIIGGPKQPDAAIQGWRAEFLIPYALLRPLQNVPPKPGTKWRANFYRMDHDDGKTTQWDWARVGAELPRIREVRGAGVLRIRSDARSVTARSSLDSGGPR